MLEERSDFENIDGIVDVGIIVPACFENPLKEESIRFLHDVLLGRKRALLPLSAIIGAYHVTTNYLSVPAVSAKSILSELIMTHSQALYPLITTDLASLALDYAAAKRIESWDGYLVALAKKFDARFVFSMDEGLGENIVDEGLAVVNPFNPSSVTRYHRFLRDNKSRLRK